MPVNPPTRRVVIVRKSPSFHPMEEAGMTPEHFYVLQRLSDYWDKPSSLQDLAASIEKFDELLMDLKQWGAFSIESPAVKTAPPPAKRPSTAAVAAKPPPAAPSCDLLRSEQQRIEGIHKALRDGSLLRLFGLPHQPSPEELRKVFESLVREYHPSLYRDKELGSYEPLLRQIFERSSQALSTLGDVRTVETRQPPKPRRRSRRIPYTKEVVVRTPLWHKPIEGKCEDISEGGLFLTTETNVPVGAPVELELAYGNRRGFLIPGKIIWRRGSGDATTGIGIKIGDLNTGQRMCWQQVLAGAKRDQPHPMAEGTAVRHQIAPDRSPIIGIDLGTTHTTVSATVGNRVVLIPFEDGRTVLPSVVAFPAADRVLVGSAALARLTTDPAHTVPSAKRLLGRAFDDPELQGHIAQAAYRIGRGPNSQALLEMWGERYAVPQICSFILKRAVHAAERALGCKVERAVLTVPVSFGPEQIDLLRRAGELAGLDILDVVEEPVAAALANATAGGFGGLIGVYDFGGGTFDFSIVDVSSDFHVLGTAGDSWLGGDDLDLSLANAVANQLWKDQRIDIRNRAVEWHHLLRGCESVKRNLSAKKRASLSVPEVLRTRDGVRDLNVRLSREQTLPLWAGAIKRSLATCEQALNLLGLRPTDLSGIYLSGGTSYIPAVRAALANLGAPVRTLVPPESSVCLGAGIHAAQIERRKEPTLRWGKTPL